MVFVMVEVSPGDGARARLAFATLMSERAVGLRKRQNGQSPVNARCVVVRESGHFQALE
jgi:hypothetical protein